MKKLWMTVGLPRSGKSTFAKKQNMPIVNPDSIRIALHGQRFIAETEPMVWIIAKYMVISLFEAGHDNVILDATNTTISRRSEWIDKRWERVFYPLCTSEEECIRRAESLNDLYIIPIIQKMAAQFEPITDDEKTEWEEKVRL